MTNIKTNDDVRSDGQKNNDKQKKKVDVATLEESTATSETNTKSPDPAAVGEASG